MTHGEVEALIEAEGREVLRQLFQSHLELRSSREVVHTDVRGADDVVRTLHRRGARKLETLLGTVALGRRLYGRRGPFEPRTARRRAEHAPRTYSLTAYSDASPRARPSSPSTR
jgi:hypothetical protein